MKLELLAKCLNELIKNRPEFADKDICIEQTSNNESKIYVAQYDETSKSWTKLYWIKNLDTIKESIKQNMKKTYKIKNYKGNLVESLEKFSKKYKGMRITEAAVENDSLKITAEAKEFSVDLECMFHDSNETIETVKAAAEKAAAKHNVTIVGVKEVDSYYANVIVSADAKDEKSLREFIRDFYYGGNCTEQEIDDVLDESKEKGNDLMITNEASGKKFWWFRDSSSVGGSNVPDEKLTISTLDQLRSAMKKKNATLALIEFLNDDVEAGQVIYVKESDDMSQKDISDEIRNVLDSFDRESGDDLEYNDED